MQNFFRYIGPGIQTGFFSLLFAVALGASAQNELPEKFLVHIDRSIYLSGETVFYKFYNTNYQKLSDHSQVVYVNFHDKKGDLLIQQKVKPDRGQGSGTITIPLTLAEDYYYITCFTKWNLQFDKSPIEAVKLSVYNPYETGSGKAEENPMAEFSEGPDLKSNIQIVLQDSPYRIRDKASFLLNLPEGVKSIVSVSIRSANSFGEADSDHLETATKPGKLSVYYQSETVSEKEQSLLIDGIVTDPETQNPLISSVLSLYKVGGSKFYRIPDRGGQVSSDVDEFSGEGQFQIFNMNPYQTEVPDFTLKLAGEKLLGLEADHPAPPRNKEIDRYIKNARLSRKIHEIFEVKTIDSLEGTLQTEFPFKADKVYLTDKYKGMKTLGEFMREIVTYAEVLQKDDQPTVRLKNRQTKHFFMENPWYLVDGCLTRDEDLVLSIPFKNLVRVELFYTDKTILEQLESMMIRTGMIAVYTDNYYLNDQIEKGINYFTFKGFSEPVDFKGIQPAGKEESRENPIFNNLIYWNPDVKSDGEAKIEIVTSDLLGEFIIEVEGVTEDGQILSGSKKFSVTY